MQDLLTIAIELTAIATVVYTVASFAAFVTRRNQPATPVIEESPVIEPKTIKVRFKPIMEVIDEALAQATPSLASLGIRELRKLGQSKGIKGARAMNKTALLSALT